MAKVVAKVYDRIIFSLYSSLCRCLARRKPSAQIFCTVRITVNIILYLIGQRLRFDFRLRALYKYAGL